MQSQTRQLAAIMFTDIVGYTAMMQQNETKAVAVIKHYNATLEKWVTHFKGQVLNYYGDGSLCIFSSATDAVNCSLAVQKELKTEPVVPLRIGLHIGEVFFEDAKALGDGVNVASRVQSLGQANTILISEEIHNKIKNNASIATVSLGHFDFKNVDKPLEVFALTNAGLFVPQRKNIEGKLKKNNVARRNVLVVLSIVLFIIAAFFVYKRIFSKNDAAGIDKSIAVLPFVDMSPNHDQEYFGDGIAEEIINVLTKIKDLKVIGRTSSFQFKDEKVDLREVGAKLAVTTVLEGSVMKSGNKIRITAQLINVEDGTHIWSERYDREIKDVFSIQDEIANKIAQKLALSMDIKRINPLTAPTTNMEAYEMTMKGNHFLRQGPAGASKAREFYQKALALDSNYSEASRGYLNTQFFLNDNAGMLKSIHKLESVNSDPESILNAKLAYYLWREGNWIKCTQLYDSARVAGFPPNITYAYYEAAIEKNMTRAIKTLENFVERDPLHLDGLRNLAMFYLFAKESHNAQTIIDKMIELDPGYIESYDLQAKVYLQQKKFSQAMEECSKAEVRFNDLKFFLRTKIQVLAKQGNLAQAKKLFYDLKVEEDPYYSWDLNYLYFSLGMDGEGFDLLTKRKNKPGLVIAILIDSFFDPYRNDPRFKELIASSNLLE